MDLLHISFPTPDGLILHGLQYRAEGSKRVLIYLHGNGHSSIFTKSVLLLELAEKFTESGCDLLAFNNRGAQAIQKITRVEGDDVIVGSALETIELASLDIAGAIAYAQKCGYTEIFLYGHSSGANKILVANERNPLDGVAGVILAGGGDDTGIWYQALGKEKFHEALETARARVGEGRGAELISPHIRFDILSFQSLADVLDPDGDYNCFPFKEASKEISLSSTPLFHALKALTLPTLVVYGSNDKYCVIPAPEAAEMVKMNHGNPDAVSIAIIPDADHSFSKQEVALAEVLSNWLKQQS